MKALKIMLLAVLTATPLLASAQGSKPNILVIWGDDIGTWNISHNNRGMMGYKTPNIDRIAKEGVAFTDYYAQQSCTAGRAAFISGSVPVRTGMTKVGMPGAEGRLAEDRRHDGHGPEEPGLRHRPVRQEPPGRPRRAPADDARLRRVPRQPLSPQRRGGAGEPRLPARHEAGQRQDLPRAVRPARRHQVQGRRQGRPDHREPRPADQEADGDDRR